MYETSPRNSGRASYTFAARGRFVKSYDSKKLEAFKTILEDLLKKKDSESLHPIQNNSKKLETGLDPKFSPLINSQLSKLNVSPEDLELIYRFEKNEFEIDGSSNYHSE